MCVMRGGGGEGQELQASLHECKKAKLDNAVLLDLLNATRLKRDDYCRRAGMDPAVEFKDDSAQNNVPGHDAVRASRNPHPVCKAFP